MTGTFGQATVMHQKSNTSRKYIPVAIPLGIISAILTIAIVYVAGAMSYSTAIEELREHEIVDLSDESRKNADRIRNSLSMLREDALSLSQHPAVLAWVHSGAEERTSDGAELLNAIARAFQNQSRLPLPDGVGMQSGTVITSGDEVAVKASDLKPYLQIRLIGADGRELVRVEQREETEDLQPIDVLDEDRAEYFDKGQRPYFLQTRELARQVIQDGSDAAAAAVYMSPVELNQERDPQSQVHGDAVIRTAVPLIASENGTQHFDGIIVINMDIDRAVRYLTWNARHIVFLGEYPANDSRIRIRTIYDSGYTGIADYLREVGRTEDLPEAEEFEGVLNRSFTEHLDPTHVRNVFYEDDETRIGMTNSLVLQMEEYGGRFPVDSPGGARLVLNDSERYFLMKLDVPPEANSRLGDILNTLAQRAPGMGASFRYPRSYNADTNLVTVSSRDRAELENLVTDLVDEYGLIRRYEEIAECKNIAAHGYRIYFDPLQPDRYLTLFAGFSEEELEADLAKTRSAQSWGIAAAAIGGGGLNFLLLLWFITRPIRTLTGAAEELARGEFDTELPTERPDEIGRLGRAFALMVSEVRERDTEIRRQNEELDRKVKEKTKDLQEKTEKLAEARDQLELAVKSRDAFLATVSHELRTPLNHIYGYSQLLEITELDDEQRSDLVKLQGSSRHLLRLVQDILDYQKVIMGRLTLRLVEFNIRHLLASVRESNEPKAAQRGNRLELRTDGLHEFSGDMFNDENRLRQVLDNLVGNACKFTTDGTITIDARAEDEFIEIRVTDTGVGISEEGLARLFRPFSKVADASLNPDGTGLGLVISRELTRMMGGDVSVTSVQNEGATFTTRVRREVPSDDEEREQLSVESDTTASITELAPKTRDTTSEQAPTQASSSQVLVIDDDPNVRELVSRFLNEAGLRVITAGSGAEGIELASRHQPTVITLDLVMPEVDGWSVLAALKANDRTADIPVVLVTVLDDPQKGYSFGAADYITKPIEGDRLKQVIRRYCCKDAPTVLVIDDNPKDQEIVCRVLRNDGCHVTVAADGAEGLTKFEESPTDLIILDLMMPVMDGFTFVEELRHRHGADMPPIIVLTATEMTTENRGRLNGMVSEVIKKGQFDRRRFLQEVHRHLDRIADDSA